jgi:glutamyl-tRNA reductase
LAAKHFLNSGAKGVMVTNRTFERAERLAEEFGGEAIPFESFLEHLHRADIVLSSTGAPHCIIGPKDAEEVVKKRRFKPIFFIDIAVPRDIDPKVDNVENAYLFTVDDLQEIVQANLAQRSLEAEKAEEIIEQEIGQFHKWLSTLEVTPTIVALRNRFDEIRRAEVEKTIIGWKDLPPGTEKRLEAMTMAIMNKLLHSPTSALKQAGQGGRVDLYVDAIRQLFELEALQRDDEELDLEE